MKQQFETWFAQEFGGEPKTAEEIVFKDSLFMAWSAGRSDAQEQLENTQREFRSADITMQNLEAKCEKLAAENAGLKAFSDKMNEMHNDLNGEGTGIQGRAEVACQQAALEAAMEEFDAIKTPATEAFLAEVRASAIPEGYALVPQQIFLEPSDIESICSQCGDGHESGYGDFTDGLLWVGSIQRDDGSIVHGMHISSADYSEEGGVTVCEFAAQLRKGVQS